MKERYHQGIFYPEGEALSSLVGEIKKEGRAKALILPHAELKRCASLYREGFSYTEGKDRVIILCPLHNGRMEGEKDFFFEGEVLPQSQMVHLGAEVNEAYAEEEPSGETISAFIEKAMPEASYAIIYCDIKTAAESKKLSSFLKKNDSPSTLFIISTNLSPKCAKKEEAEEWRERAKEALIDCSLILDKANHHKLSFCGSGIIDAFERAFGGGWKHLADCVDDSTTAHSLLIKEESN